MNQDLVKRTKDWTALLAIFVELGYDEKSGRRPVGEIMEFVPDVSTGLPPFRSALKNIEARWDLTDGRRLSSIRFYFAPIEKLSRGDYTAIKLIPPRSSERIPGEASVFDPLSMHEQTVAGVLRFAPRSDDSWETDKRMLKQTVWEKSDALQKLDENRRMEVIRVFYKRFGLLGTPAEQSITMATVKRVIGKTMAFEHVVSLKTETGERPIEEIVFYGCVADFTPEWPTEPKPHFTLTFRFATHSRIDAHRLQGIVYFMMEEATAAVAYTHDGEKERALSGILTFAD